MFIEIIDFKESMTESGTFLGYLTVEIPEAGIVLGDIKLNQKMPDKIWIYLPCKRLREPNGEIRWKPIFSFSDPEKQVEFVENLTRVAEAFLASREEV